MVGFPFSAGRTNFGEDGARSPTRGTGKVSIGGGANHDDNSLDKLILTAAAREKDV